MRCALLLAIAACSSDSPTTPPDALVASDGATVDDAPAADGTAGCGMPSAIATATWVMRTVATDRAYFIRLPAGYDPARRYPIVYQQHGCSSSPSRETNNVPLDGQVGDGAILVRGRAAGNCWDTSPTGVDVPYWDAMRTDVEANWCIDANRRFATGYSSGAFMTHRLACIRGGLLRGIATIAGGQAESNCQAPVAALLIHDTDDSVVDIAKSIAARDSHLARNSCGTTTMPTDHPPCASYDGCTLPVAWCETSGRNHDRQDAVAAPIFWSFLSAL